MEALDLQSEPGGGRVVVAMSGGVDSSVTAALLAERGYDVVGITLQLYDHGQASRGQAVTRRGACCAGQDIHDARRVAERLDIPHYVLDYESRFRQSVIDDFADSYLRGETPIPCIRCNQTVKFRDLLGMARDLGAVALFTGHYARRVPGPGGPELHRAVDPDRDQSYFLFATTAEQLEFLRFPLGGIGKAETRALAKRLGLPVAEKPDSQDICFVPDGNYAGVIAKLRPGADLAGEIVDLAGRRLGRHDGIVHYTIGQRRGLGLGGRPGGDTEPLYVVRLDPANRRVVVGPRAALDCARVTINQINWLGAEPPSGGMRATVKLRSTGAALPATVLGAPNGWAEIVLDRPEPGVSPGQACVIYQGDRLVGGGWIVATEAARAG